MGTTLDLAQLRTFVAIADSDGFGRAAATLGLSQSTVSQHVRSLERDLGQRLVEKDGRKARFTADGERLLVAARRISAVYNDALDHLGDDRSRTTVLGASDTVAERVLPGVLAALRAPRSAAGAHGTGTPDATTHTASTHTTSTRDGGTHFASTQHDTTQDASAHATGTQDATAQGASTHTANTHPVANSNGRGGPDAGRVSVQITTSRQLLSGLARGAIDLAVIIGDPGEASGIPVGTLPLSWYAAPGWTPTPAGTELPIVTFSEHSVIRVRGLRVLAEAGSPVLITAESVGAEGAVTAARAGLGAVPLASDLPVLHGLLRVDTLPSLGTLGIHLASRPGVDPAIVDVVLRAARAEFLAAS